MSDMKISITLDAAQLKRELGLTQDELKKVDGQDLSVKTDNAQSSIGKLRDSLAMWGLAINGAITAAKGLASAINSVVAPAMVQEKAEKDLAAALKNTGVYSAQLEAQLRAQASAIQSVTKYGDESILMATRQMQVIGRLSAEQLPAAQKAAIGLAAAYGMNLNTAFEMVGKAAAGNTATLSRYGIVLEEGLSSAEKFDQVLRIGADGFGLAQAEANTTSGALQQLNNLWGDLKEILGTFVLPVLGELAGALSGVTKWLIGQSDIVKVTQKQTQELTSNYDYLTGKVLEYKKATSLTTIEQRELDYFIGELNSKYPEYINNIDLHAAGYDEVANAVALAREELQSYVDQMVRQSMVDKYSQQITKMVEARYEAMQKVQELQKVLDSGAAPAGSVYRSAVEYQIATNNMLIDATREQEQALRDEIATISAMISDPFQTGSGDGSGTGTGTAAATTAEISETAKAYEQLLDGLRKYHSDAALEKLSAHQRALAELDQQFQEEQAVVLASMAAQEITEAEGQSRLLEIRGKFDAQAANVQKKADDEIIALAQKRIEQAVRDEESYYETMKFADEGSRGYGYRG